MDLVKVSINGSEIIVKRFLLSRVFIKSVSTLQSRLLLVLVYIAGNNNGLLYMLLLP